MQAEAAVKSAQVSENDTSIFAPTDGTVVRKTANVGASLSAGQTILTLTQGQGVYITANFKETQVGNVRVGQPVEIRVDSFPGKVFKGVVGSLNQATGATTSLVAPGQCDWQLHESGAAYPGENRYRAGNRRKRGQSRGHCPIATGNVSKSGNRDKRYGSAPRARPRRL